MKRSGKIFSTTTLLPSATAKQGHELGLQVGGEPRIGLRRDVDGMEEPLDAGDRAAVAVGLHGDADVPQPVHHGHHVVKPAVADMHLTAGDRGGRHERPGLDPVRDDAVLHRVQVADAVDGQSRRADPADAGTHRVEAVGQVGNLRLAGGRFDDGPALGQGGGHHDVGRAENGRAERAAQEDARPFEALRRSAMT